MPRFSMWQKRHDDKEQAIEESQKSTFSSQLRMLKADLQRKLNLY